MSGQSGSSPGGRALAQDPPIDPNVAVGEDVESAFEPRIPDLRRQTARGVVINSFFQVGIAGIGLLRSLALAAFLTTTEYGLMGLIVTTMITLIYLKQIGVSDKFVQQEDDDQEAAFQSAFSVEVIWSFLLLGLVLIVVPLYGFVIYDRPEIVVPSLVLSLILPATALQSPIWISYRDMQFVRQRVLESVDPVVGIMLTVGLAVAGFGYWSIVVGSVVGALAGAGVAIVSSPYPIRWRFERSTLREYFDFSWPLLALALSSLVVVQGALIVGNWTVGLTGIAAIGLAGSFAAFADRLDGLIRRTIYPAVCVVKDRRELMFEAFVKSNRLALIWGLPVGVGLALFGPDLVTFVLGEKWRDAAFLIQVFGLLIGLRQVAFNWSLFFQALGRTRPMAVNGASAVVVFLFVTAPLMFVIGVDGYAVGMIVTVIVDLALRSHYLREIFEGFRLARHMLRAVAASVPAVVVVLAMRLAESDRTLALVLAELGLYLLVTVVATCLLERKLILEVLGYLRGERAEEGIAELLSSPARA